MSSEFFLVSYLHSIHHFCFLLGQINNLTLLSLIYHKANEKFGTYRYIMAVFSAHSLVYAWIEISTMPLMYSKVPGFVIMMNSRWKSHVELGHFLVASYCGTFGLCIAFLASQFVYRYIAVCKQEYTRFVDGYKCVHFMWPCVVICVIWFSLVYFGMGMSVEKQEFFRDDVFRIYSENITSIGFAALLYWDKQGNWNFDSLFSIVGFDIIIAICVTVILFCGISIFHDLREKENLMSVRKVDLQKQLFITLTFQTLLPFILMYLAVGFVITSPLLSIEVGKFANITGFTVAIYPSLEPCIAILCIRDFRNAVMFWKKAKIRSTWTLDSQRSSGAAGNS